MATLQNYRIAGRLGEGTFSEVLKCQSLVDGKLYACKKMKQKYESMEQVNSLREIQALRRLNPHPNVIELQEVVFDRHTGTLALICELMDMNIYELIKDRRSYLSESKVKLYMYQLCKSIYHMHRNGIFHRDVKPENILIKGNVLKLADYGSCKSVYSKQPFTEYISTRWYRAPECLLTDGIYDFRMDMWSVGCVIFEIMSLKPLFAGSNELDQVDKIHGIVGTPSPAVLQKFRKHQSRHIDFNFRHNNGTGVAPLLKHASRGCIDLISRLCTYDPDERFSAKQALRHPYFKDIREAERRAKQIIQTPSIASDLASTRLLGGRKQHRHQRQSDLHLPTVSGHYSMGSTAASNPVRHGHTITLPQIAHHLPMALTNKSTANYHMAPSSYSTSKHSSKHKHMPHLPSIKHSHYPRN